MEKILRVEELSNYKTGEYGFVYDGYEIFTDKQSIKLLIDTDQQCCETSGYFWCNDNPKDFIGASLLDIKLTDTELNEAVMIKNECETNGGYWEGGIMFVNIETDKGVLQFVAYNQHNGYYGHKALVISKQLTHDEYL